MNCLEQQLGRILFVRTNRGVQLTRDGEQLYSYVEAAMSQLLTAEDELADGENLTHGSITIGVSETALNIYLLDRLRAFHMAYPGINLKIYNHSTPPADVEAPLKKIVLQSYREILIGGTTFSSLKKQKLSIAEMRNYPMICLGRETMTFRFYDRIFREHGVELAPDTEAATTDQILPLVKCELGLAFIPELMAREAVKNKEVVKLSLEEKLPDRNVCLVYDCLHPLNEAAKQFKKIIVESR
jgi:DNA-binding transcriptional LysR family regulator